VTVLAGAAALVAGACSGGSKAATPTTTSSVASTTTSTSVAPSSTSAAASTTTTPVARYPFTGLAVTDPSTQNRPALVVKIDNHAEARPQTGLNQADVVYEEEVEGITRFFTVFHSQIPGPVGPIRSARTQEIERSPNGICPGRACRAASEIHPFQPISDCDPGSG